jgi:TolB-like protein/DNA-binding winged helix-turn-helix (wHTH) protein
MAEDPLNAASSASQQLQKASRLRFGPFTLDHQRAELLRDGVVVPLRPKPFLLLSVFAAQPGRVLSKEELLEAAWPGVVVTDDSLTQCVHELRTALGDAGAVLLRTVPRRGYRFDAAVTADPAPATLSPATGASLEIGATGSAVPLLSDARSATSDKETAAALVQPRRRVLLATTVLVLVLVASVAAWLAARGPDSTSSSTPRSELASTPALSVVVLPLAVEVGAKDSEWFADALLGDLTTEVARLQGSFVIARDTAHTYKGRAVDPRTVAKELGVRYVVQGSLRHDGRSIRLNLALIDGTSGAQRWSEKFDFDRAELNKALDDIVSRLARFLSIELWRSAADRSATLSPDQVTADDLAMRAFALWFRGFSRENVNQALALCEQAVARDPNSIRGWGGIAFMNVQAGLNNWAADRAAAFRRVDDAALNLERLDPDGFYTYQAKVIQSFIRKDWTGVLRLSELWVEHHPSHPVAYGGLGMSLISNGRAEEAVPQLERALRLSPRDSFRAEWQYRLAFAHFTLGRYEQAHEWGRTAQAANPGLPWPPIHAAALVRLGRKEEARQAFEEFSARHPRFQQEHVAQRLNASHPVFIEALDRLIASLGEVGLR